MVFNIYTTFVLGVGLIFGSSIGGVVLLVCFLIAVCTLKKRNAAKSKQDIELQNVTKSEHISIEKNAATKNTIQTILNSPWIINEEFYDIEYYSSKKNKGKKYVPNCETLITYTMFTTKRLFFYFINRKPQCLNHQVS